MSKKYVQLQKFQTHQPKRAAISLVERHINENLSNFKDGEEIAIEYTGEDGEQAYVSAIVKNDGTAASVYVPVNEFETLKITDSENEPEDKKSLWLTEYSLEPGHENIHETVSSLLAEYKKLKEIVLRHDYALATSLNSGDIILNSQKYDIENESEEEKPEDAEYDEDYAEDDFVITSYDIFVAGSSLRRFSSDSAMLYAGQKYKLTLKLYNKSKELVPETSDVSVIFRHAAEVEINERRFLTASLTGYTTILSEVRVNGVLIDNEPYFVNFGGEQEPDYETYDEPNVHHIQIKTADTYDILQENVKYLLPNEFCWCPEKNTLYLKAKAKNGSIQLFVINGNTAPIDPDDPTSGDTTAVTSEVKFEIIDERLIITSSEDAVFVDESGLLNINVGGRVDNGVLILNDTQTTGSTPEQSTAVIGSDGVLNIGGNTTESGGVIMLNANVTGEGILEITT